MHKPDTYIFTREQVREVDRRAIEDYGIPGIVLMENAARGTADIALEMFAGHDSPSVLLLAGGGNNGGDAFAITRHLHNARVNTQTVSLKPADTYTGDAATNLAILDAMNLPHCDDLKQVEANDYDLIIDGVFGTGLAGTVRAPFDAVIKWINDQLAPVLSIDIPSGLDCDTGEPLGCAIRADVTATFVGTKQGFANKSAGAYLGEVHIVDIGVPRELVSELGSPN